MLRWILSPTRLKNRTLEVRSRGLMIKYDCWMMSVWLGSRVIKSSSWSRYRTSNDKSKRKMKINMKHGRMIHIGNYLRWWETPLIRPEEDHNLSRDWIPSTINWQSTKPYSIEENRHLSNHSSTDKKRPWWRREWRSWAQEDEEHWWPDSSIRTREREYRAR